MFRVDTTVRRRMTKPNRGNLWVIRIYPKALRLGAHRVRATVTFLPQSGTARRTLTLTFRRCSSQLRPTTRS